MAQVVDNKAHLGDRLHDRVGGHDVGTSGQLAADRYRPPVGLDLNTAVSGPGERWLHNRDQVDAILGVGFGLIGSPGRPDHEQDQ